MDELIKALLETGYPFAHFGWSHAPTATTAYTPRTAPTT